MAHNCGTTIFVAGGPARMPIATASQPDSIPSHTRRHSGAPARIIASGVEWPAERRRNQ